MEKKKILILVDVQKDFIDGSLANKDAQACMPAIIEKIKNFDGNAIYLTMDTHFKTYLDTPEGKKLPVEHCIYGTPGWQIDEEVQKLVEAQRVLGTNAKYVLKPTFGSVEPTIANTEGQSLVELVLDMERQASSEAGEVVPMEIEMCGFCTDICVVSNALILKAFTYDFAEITVNSKCCAGVTPEKHEAALEVMRSCQINVV